MDRETRNRIQRATQAARELLEHEYAEQLEGVFDIRLDGTIAAEPGDHLDAAQRVLRRKLVTAVEHQCTSGMSNADAVASYLREAAFTTLNRFVALKMLEARELVQECVSRADRSAGFKEFTGLAPGLVQLPDRGYRTYIETLFDEIGREVRVLFDRRDPASLLWPRRQGLVDLLSILNAPALESVWAKDETIGWVYQYFNSDDDRHAARYDEQDKPRAPNSSYELAVRNQFFTPRYVVEFLVANTLGRTWLEMRLGDTELSGTDYLIHRPCSVFAPDDQLSRATPDSVEKPRQSISYPLIRAKKDPRDIRVLDPACGSGHFLLHAFDLFLTIYEEAWSDIDSPKSAVTETTLRDEFPDIDTLRNAVPMLILQHNLYGAEIDSRCAQVASLALWLRAQKAYRDYDVDRAARPRICNVNVVVGEPIPADEEILNKFADALDHPSLRPLFREFVREMQIANELGSLLDPHQVVADLVARASETRRHNDVFSGAVTDDFWKNAGQSILEALRTFVGATANDSLRRKLFVDDTVRGLSFVDLLRQKFDVVLMNPPFGSGTPAAKETLSRLYPDNWKDLYAAFLELGLRVLEADGLLGAITSSTYFNLSSFSALREHILSNSSPVLFADFRYGVMDDALVPAACAVLQTSTSVPRPIVFVDARFSDDKAAVLRTAAQAARSNDDTHSLCVTTKAELEALPDKIFAYWLGPGIRRVFRECPSLGDAGIATFGLHARGGDERFYRAWWELPAGQLVGRDWPVVKLGGNPQHFLRDSPYVVDWRNDASLLREVASRASGGTFTGREHYFRSGLSYLYTSRTTFSVQPLEKGSVFTAAAHGLFPGHDADVWLWLGWLNSESVRLLTKVINPNRFFQASYVRRIPVPDFSMDEVRTVVEHHAKRAHAEARMHLEGDECSRCFAVDWATLAGASGGGSPFRLAETIATQRAKSVAASKRKIDQAIQSAYGIDDAELEQLSQRVGASTALPLPATLHLQENGYRESIEAHLSALVGLAFRRWDLSRWTLSPGLPDLPDAFEALPDTQRLANLPSLADSVKVSDEGHQEDLTISVLRGLRSIWGARADSIEREVAEFLEPGSGSADAVRRWLETAFFPYHLSRYSHTKAKAPVYWRLGGGGSYSIWLFYPALSADSLFRVLNDFVEPKLRYEEQRLVALEKEAKLDRSSQDRSTIAAQADEVEHLRWLRTEIAQIAPIWRPQFTDGVLLNFSPLWRLVPHHRAWQKECKATWDKLCKGDYDWSLIAMHLWPERVVPKCAKDRSLAIAHGLADVFWCQDEASKWKPRKVAQTALDELVAERSSAAVKDALKSLLDAPASPTGKANRRKASRGNGSRRTTGSSRPKAAANSASASTHTPAAKERDILIAIRDAIAAAEDGASRAEVIAATCISAGQWQKAIRTLLAEGSVKQRGAARSVRYHLVGSGD